MAPKKILARITAALSCLDQFTSPKNIRIPTQSHVSAALLLHTHDVSCTCEGDDDEDNDDDEEEEDDESEDEEEDEDEMKKELDDLHRDAEKLTIRS